MRLDSTGSAVHNAILLSIPDNEYNLLRRHLEHIEFPQHHILQEAGAKIEFAYFLNGGMASLVVLTSDGRSVEVAIVGKDGIVGTSLSVGLELGPQRAVMQIPGVGLRVKSSVLMDVLKLHARTAGEMESLRVDSGLAGGSDRGLQPSS